jgi:V8-like Glu-specific endopeptidase
MAPEMQPAQTSLPDALPFWRIQMPHTTSANVAHSITLVVALFAAACSYEPTPESTESTALRIIGGRVDAADNAVGFITFPDGKGGEFTCTGTLIAPNVMLTAGHCSVTDDTCNGGGGPAQCTANPASGYSVFGGTTPADNNDNIVTPTWKATVLENHPHPSFGTTPTNGLLHNDVGILILDKIQVISGAAPTPVPWLKVKDDAAFATGTKIRAVGYGVSDGRAQVGSGTKRQVSMTIQSHDDMLFHSGNAKANTCDGDSGGPLFAIVAGVETLIGTTTSGDQFCVKYADSTRVDAEATFIATFASPSPKVAPPVDPKTQPPRVAACAHALDVRGVALSPSCSPVVQAICNDDPFCCKEAWDTTCIGEAASH